MKNAKSEEPSTVRARCPALARMVRTTGTAMGMGLALGAPVAAGCPTAEAVSIFERDDPVFETKTACVRGYPFRCAFKTVDGIATGGKEYTSQSGKLNVPPLATQVSVAVKTVDDSNFFHRTPARESSSPAAVNADH